MVCNALVNIGFFSYWQTKSWGLRLKLLWKIFEKYVTQWFNLSIPIAMIKCQLFNFTLNCIVQLWKHFNWIAKLTATGILKYNQSRKWPQILLKLLRIAHKERRVGRFEIVICFTELNIKTACLKLQGMVPFVKKYSKWK